MNLFVSLTIFMYCDNPINDLNVPNLVSLDFKSQLID